MVMFRYEALNGKGDLVRGVLDARDEQELSARLDERGFRLRQAFAPSQQTAAPNQRTPRHKATAMGATSSRIAAVTLASGLPVTIRPNVPPSALANFFRQLVTMVRSGIPLHQSFAEMIPYMRSGRIRHAAVSIQQTLQQGGKLSDGMAAYPHIFPVFTIAGVWCGELSGKLDIILEWIAEDLEREAVDTRWGKIGWLVFKSNLIGLVASFPLFDMQVVLAPSLQGDVSPGGVLGHILNYYAAHSLPTVLIVVGSIVLSWFVWGILKRVPAVKLTLDRLLLGVPIWGALHRARSLATFARMMDAMLTAGLNVSTAWQAASLTPRNSAIAEKLLRAAPSAGGSGTVVDRIAASQAFSQDDIGMIAAGEKSGRIPEAMDQLYRRHLAAAEGPRIIGRAWSWSLQITSLIIIQGIAIIELAYTYRPILTNLLGDPK